MKSPDTIAYFERLAMTSYFLIGNLQETKLSYMAIKELEGWFDDKAINGFKIDGLAPGAGNIPTGNGSAETKNHFILTPEDLAAKYESVLNNPVEKEALRGDLTAMLSYMKPIFSYCGDDAEGVYSKPDLLGKSKQLMTNIVQSQSRTSINVKMLEADIKKFNFVPDTKLKESGFTIDVKKQLYRFPSILLFDLSIVFGVRAESAWQTTHQLLAEGKTSTQLTQVLEFILACACFIRLSAYLYHNSHDDRISVADEEINPGREVAPQHRRWFVPVELFISLCDDMIPLKKQLKSYNFVNTSTLLLETDPSALQLSKIQTLHYCGRHRDALNELNKVFGSDLIANCGSVIHAVEGLEGLEALVTLAEVLIQCSEYRAALEYSSHLYNSDKLLTDNVVRLALCYRGLSYYHKALELLETVNQSEVVSQLLGKLFLDVGDYQKAEDHLLAALESYYSQGLAEDVYDYYGEPLKKKVRVHHKTLVDLSPTDRLSHLKNPTLSTASVISTLGWLYYRQHNTELAGKYFEKYQELASDIYGAGALVTAYAQLLKNFGDNQYLMGYHNKAGEYYKQSIDMFYKIYGKETSHADIANLLNNLGNIQGALGRLITSSDLYHESLTMYKSVYGEDANHIDIARTLRNLMSNHMTMNKHDEAVECANTSLRMYRAVYGEDANHVDIASLLACLGLTYTKMRQYETSENYHSEALKTYRAVYGSDANHTDIARVLIQRAINYDASGQPKKSEECLAQAQAMYLTIYGETRTGENYSKNLYTNAMSDLGIHYNETGQYSKATDCYDKALNTYSKVYPTDNRRIARIMNNHAGNYMCMGNNHKAVEYCLKALEMYQEIFGAGSDQLSIARLLCNLGGSYCGLGQYENSLESLEKSLEMYRHLYGSDANHYEIARVLVKLYTTHLSSGQLAQARVRASEALDMYLIADPQHAAIPHLQAFLQRE